MEFVVATQLRAVGGRFAENVDFRCSLLVLQRGNLTLELFEEILQADSSLSLHVVVQVALLNRLSFIGIDNLLLLVMMLVTQLLLLAVSVLLVAVVNVVVVVLALSTVSGCEDVSVRRLRADFDWRRALAGQR